MIKVQMINRIIKRSRLFFIFISQNVPKFNFIVFSVICKSVILTKYIVYYIQYLQHICTYKYSKHWTVFVNIWQISFRLLSLVVKEKQTFQHGHAIKSNQWWKINTIWLFKCFDHLLNRRGRERENRRKKN